MRATRKRLSNDPKGYCLVQVRLRPEDGAALRALAMRRGLALSALVRTTVRELLDH